PAARERPVVIYDPVRDRALLFGGAGATYMNDVWELSLDSNPEWRRITYAGAPPSPRGSHGGVYDPVRDRLVIFGGNTLESWNNTDTWALSLGGVPTWKQIAPDGTQPPGRSMAAAVYDAPRDRMVILDGSGSPQDIWALSLDAAGAWRQLTPGGTGPRSEMPMAIYDSARGSLVVIG